MVGIGDQSVVVVSKVQPLTIPARAPGPAITYDVEVLQSWTKMTLKA